MDFEIDGNAAIVTASSSGLGKASAKALAREGVNTTLNGRNEERLEEAHQEVQDIAPSGTDVIAVPGDLTKEEDLQRLVDETVDEFGRLDHLVTSAGGPPSGPFLDIDEEDWYYTYDMLVMSVVRLAHLAEPHLKKDGGGTIVNITSKTVKEASDNLVLSNSVRSAVTGLAKTLSIEFAPEIRTNSVLPSSIGTARSIELLEQAVERGELESVEEGLDQKGEGIPLQRVGDPMELGNTVAFLSSPKSGFVNGVAIPICGGGGACNL